MYGGKYEKNAVYFFTRFTSIITRSPKTADSSIEWTADELLFIANHSEVKVGVDLKFVPFEFIDIDEKYKGVASDYIAIIEQKIGIDFVITPNLSWTEAYDLAKAGEIDILPAISKTTEREEFFLFSESYYQFKKSYCDAKYRNKHRRH